MPPFAFASLVPVWVPGLGLVMVEAATSSSAVESVERLGGWAVVVWIVVWLTKRWEKIMGDQIEAHKQQADQLVKLTDALQEHESNEVENARRIAQAHDRMADKFGQLTEKLINAVDRGGNA